MSLNEELGETVAASSRPVDVEDVRLRLIDDGERYELRRTLGQGGMGTIDLRFDKRIGRELAVKQIRRESLGQPGVRARFLREARVQGQLDHPAVVPVFDLGVRDDVPYFTMRRIHGVTLEEAIKHSAGPDPLLREKYGRRRLLTAFVSACLAIDYAHTRGVLHRDLKPANVMLGDFGEVYLLDWGVAKVGALHHEPSPASGEQELAATQAGHAMGTLGYMAPEQLRGDVAQVGPRSDIYSLGVVLFELLAHEPLHPRDSREHLTASTLSSVDARPSQRRGGKDTPVELDQICVRATSLFPADRHASARELATAVERYLDGDRDLEKRRDAAREHSQKARELAARMHDTSRSPDERVADRKLALRQLGQALTFDPAEPSAMATLLEMMNDVPGELPRELVQQLADTAERGRRRISFVGTSVYVAGIPLVAFSVWHAQVRSWAWSLGLLVSLALAAVMAAWFRRLVLRTDRPPPLFIPGAIVIVLSTSLYGPLLEAPMFAIVNIIAWSLHASGRRRWIGVATSIFAWCVPYFLQEAGVMPATYDVVNGDLVVHSLATSFDGRLNSPFMMLLGLVVALTCSVMVGGFRDLRYKAELQRGWSAWQLRQLAPERS